QPRAIGTAEEEALRQTGMKDGIAWVRADRPTQTMLLLLAISTLCISPFFMVMMPLYSRNILQVGPYEHGLLMASSGVGAFVGSLFLLSIPQVRRSSYLRLAIGAISGAMLVLSLSRHLAVSIGSMIVLTLGTSTVFGLANTIVQERAPDPIRGRISAIVGLSFFGVLPFSGLLVASFADLAGLRAAMATAAICYGIGGGLLLYFHRRSSHRERTADHDASAPEEE
ncbi:MAG TPA: MFS transporter, partial [Chthoniobacteraceae bacterium]